MLAKLKLVYKIFKLVTIILTVIKGDSETLNKIKGIFTRFSTALPEATSIVSDIKDILEVKSK